MKLTLIDITIIAGYLVATIVIGLVLKKRAQKNQESYLLGGKSMPWYMLGLSNASGMFDISGTMWLVTGLFVYGLKSVWLPWLWPVFNQVFLMVFLSQWLRKSNVTTGAEWISTRFGKGRGANLSHTIIVIFAIVNGLGFLAYGFIGLGKFVEIFVPWELVAPYVPFEVSKEYIPHFYGTIFTLFAVFYSLIGGMLSIVWADLLQFAIMTVSSLVIAYIAMTALYDSTLMVPEGWTTPLFNRYLELDWSNIIPEVSEKIKSDGYQIFSAFFMMTLCKGFLVSAAGPAPTYDMQKILATKSPSDAAKMSGFVSVVLMPVRYLMIAGFAVLAILFYDKLDLMVGNNIDFEQVLPSAISEFVPVGLLGLLLAGLLAAFMSTFAGTLNAVQAYIINDLYVKRINPKASNKQLSTANYMVGIIIVLISIILGILSKDVNQILQIIVSALWGGYVAANLLKWYWWRFNAYGFFWGMVFGMVASAVPFFATNILEFMYPDLAVDIRYLFYFPVILIVSLVGCIVGTYASPVTDYSVLKNFYKTVNPWGFWKPVKHMVLQDNPSFEPNKNFKRDMFNIIIGIIAQTSLVILPIYVVLLKMTPSLIAIGIFVVCAVLLKKFWWNKLEN